MKLVLRNSNLVISSVVYQVEISSNGEVVPTITLSGKGEIHYTLDGTTPTSQSPVYIEPFYLLETTTIKAAIIKDGEVVSDVASETINVAAPANTYWNGRTLTANSSTPTPSQSNGVNTTNVNSGDYVVMKFTITSAEVTGATSYGVRLRTSDFIDVVSKGFGYGDGQERPVLNKEYIVAAKATSSYILKYAALQLTGTPTSGDFVVNITGYIYSGSNN